MKRSKVLIRFSYVLLIPLVLESCQTTEPQTPSTVPDPRLSGGSQTVFDQGGGAYSHTLPLASASTISLHAEGDSSFGGVYTATGSGAYVGLGPIFNAASCEGCHQHDGAGHPPQPGDPVTSLLIRLSIPGTNPHGGPNPAPGFGGQLQEFAITGARAEADVTISHSYQKYAFADGTTYELEVPSYSIVNAYIPLPGGLMISPRVAQRNYGLGLLASIPDDEILANADENDLNHDGISGRPNWVWDVQKQQLALGRFGWKAGQPTLLQQSAAAYNQDMGLTNMLFSDESSKGQSQWGSVPDTGNSREVPDGRLKSVVAYLNTLAVPAARNVDDPQVIRGRQIFGQAQCASCHTPMQTTGVNSDVPELSNQVIFPYTDLLLHDMGPDLADNRPEFVANGQEWRTPPLWGIGLSATVSGNTRFLHDGRARSLIEAVMWHGGEALHAREYVRALSTDDRNALIRFLESL